MTVDHEDHYRRLKLMTASVASWDYLIRAQRLGVDADVFMTAVDNWFEATEALTVDTIKHDPTHVATPEIERENYHKRTFRRAMRAVRRSRFT